MSTHTPLALTLIDFSEWLFMAPQLVLALALVALSFFGMKQGWATSFGLLGHLGALAALYFGPSTHLPFLLDNFLYGPYYELQAYLTLGISLSTYLFWDQKALHKQEWQGALLALSMGVMLLCASRNLMVAVLSFELIGFATYLMAGVSQDKKASASALQYLLTGGFASALMLFGFSLIYMLQGSLRLDALFLINHPSELQQIAIVLIISGLLFKLGLVPFHAWVSNVFRTGSPVSLYAISLLPKIGGFSFAYLLLSPLLALSWFPWVALGLVALSITLGNIVALSEKRPYQVLAFSSVAQSGFFVAALFFGNAAMPLSVFYWVLYAPALLLAFYLLSRFETKLESFEALEGLGHHRKSYGLALTFGAMSLAGLPPLAGFWGKLQYFLQSLEQAEKYQELAYVLLAVLVLNTVLGFAYYLRFPYALYFGDKNTTKPPTKRTNFLILALCVFLVLAAWAYAGPLLELLKASL